MSLDNYYRQYNEAEYALKHMQPGNNLSRMLASVKARLKRRNARIKIRRAVSHSIELPDLRKVGNPDYIVSLTTFPARLEGLPKMLRSIFLQKFLPGEIIIWLCEGEFGSEDREKLSGLDEFRDKGLRIEFVPEPYKPHLKYYHAFLNYPDKHVITVDDDLIYSPETITALVELSIQFQGSVCAARVRKITRTGDTFDSYNQWPNMSYYNSPHCSKDLIALGYGGVLYPAGEYRMKFCNPELFTRLSPRADDLWLKAVGLSENIQVATGMGYFPHPVLVPGSQKVTLLSTNMTGTGNDEQWQKLDRHFGLSRMFSPRKK